MSDKKHLSWGDVRDLAHRVALPLSSAGCVYGVPRGGIHAAAAMVLARGGRMADAPEEADVIVDDIVDSGRTRDAWRTRFPDKPFVALLDYSVERGPWVVFPWEKGVEEGPEENVRRLLQYIGEDPTREGLQETPARFIKALAEMTGGLHENPAAHLAKSFDLADTAAGVVYDEMVISRSVPFVSLCEHHLLPFSGVAHMAYIPGNAEGSRVVGLSKLARMFDGFARRPQVQERLTQQACNAIVQVLKPVGAAVVVKAQHTCQCFRGVRKSGDMVTSALAGVLKDNSAARAELFALLRL